jgi:hypothetical protein
MRKPKVNSIVAFTYKGKNRMVRVGSVNPTHLKGWDYTAGDTLGGGYRTFLVNEVRYMTNPARFNPLVVG